MIERLKQMHANYRRAQAAASIRRTMREFGYDMSAASDEDVERAAIRMNELVGIAGFTVAEAIAGPQALRQPQSRL